MMQFRIRYSESTFEAVLHHDAIWIRYLTARLLLYHYAEATVQVALGDLEGRHPHYLHTQTLACTVIHPPTRADVPCGIQ